MTKQEDKFILDTSAADYSNGNANNSHNGVFPSTKLDENTCISGSSPPDYSGEHFQNRHNGDLSLENPAYSEKSTKLPADTEYISGKQNKSKVDSLKSGLSGSLRKWLVLPVCLLYFGSFTVAFITFQQFVYAKLQRDKFPNITFNTSIPLCQANESDPNYAIQTEVQQEAAEWMSYFTLAFGIPSIFSDLILGAYTDRFGRKFLFFLPCIGSFLHLAVNAIGIYTDFALYWYIPVGIVDGLSGHVFGFLLVAFSYIADITPPGAGRSLGIVLIELVIGIAAVGFSLSTGVFIQNTGFFWPMFSAAILVAVCLPLVIFLPETYPKENRQQMASGWGNLRNAFGLFFGKENSGKRWMYNSLIVTFILTIFTILGRVNVETLYQLNNPFCWDPERLGWFFALRSGSQQVLGMALVKPLQHVFSDETIAIIGGFSLIAGFTLEGLAKTDVLLYIGKILCCNHFSSTDQTKGFAKRVDPDKTARIWIYIDCLFLFCHSSVWYFVFLFLSTRHPLLR